MVHDVLLSRDVEEDGRIVRLSFIGISFEVFLARLLFFSRNMLLHVRDEGCRGALDLRRVELVSFSIAGFGGDSRFGSLGLGFGYGS
jgi:hypothetical protein